MSINEVTIQGRMSLQIPMSSVVHTWGYRKGRMVVSTVFNDRMVEDLLRKQERSFQKLDITITSMSFLDTFGDSYTIKVSFDIIIVDDLVDVAELTRQPWYISHK